MANPWHHAVSSARRFGGEPEDYLQIHEWFDEPKSWFCDQRQRAVRHHAEGIGEAVRLFKPVVLVTHGGRFHSPTCRSHWDVITHRCTCGRKTKTIPVRWVAEQHVLEDLGRVPTAAEWLSQISLQHWMVRSRKLSREV